MPFAAFSFLLFLSRSLSLLFLSSLFLFSSFLSSHGSAGCSSEHLSMTMAMRLSVLRKP